MFVASKPFTCTLANLQYSKNLLSIVHGVVVVDRVISSVRAWVHAWVHAWVRTSVPAIISTNSNRNFTKLGRYTEADMGI